LTGWGRFWVKDFSDYISDAGEKLRKRQRKSSLHDNVERQKIRVYYKQLKGSRIEGAPTKKLGWGWRTSGWERSLSRRKKKTRGE